MSYRNDVHGLIIGIIKDIVKFVVTFLLFMALCILTIPMAIIGYLINKNLVWDIWSKGTELLPYD